MLAIVSAVVFVIFYVFPSADPAILRAGRNASPDQVEAIRHSLGLDRPVYTQYYEYMKGIVLHFDFGYSYRSNADVRALILDRLPATIWLVTGAAILWLAMGIPVGIISAIKRRSLLDRTTMVTSLAFISAPVFWLGLVALYLFAQDVGLIHIFPGIGSYADASSPGAKFESMLLPWIVLAAASAAIYARYLRSSMIDVMSEDYIRTARAKGLPESTGDHAPRRPQRNHPDRHPARARHRRAAGRQRDPHRDRLQHPGGWAARLHGDSDLRSAGDPGGDPVRSLLHHHLQPDRRHRLRVPRSEGEVPMTRLLEVEDLKVHFETEDGVLKAVDGVSFAVDRGETLGIVGESGCGKSVANLSILGLTRAPTTTISGRISYAGHDLAQATDEELRGVRGKEIAMIFQDPLTSLHPFYRVGWQLVEAVQAHQDVSKAVARRRALELLGMVGIPDPAGRIDNYPHEFSGGMRQRAMIAMALINDPTVLIADEPTTALDVTIQAQILSLISRLQEELGMAVILITHDLGVIAEVADRVNIMYAGRIVESGTLDQTFYDPQHPYTWGLLGSLPRPDRPRTRRLAQVKGQPPSLLAPPQGCHFRPRCPHAFERCTEVPALEARGGGQGHPDRCWLSVEQKRALRVLESGAIGLQEPAA